MKEERKPRKVISQLLMILIIGLEWELLTVFYIPLTERLLKEDMGQQVISIVLIAPVIITLTFNSKFNSLLSTKTQ